MCKALHQASPFRRGVSEADGEVSTSLRAATSAADDGHNSSAMTSKTAVARRPGGHFSVERQTCLRLQENALRDLKNAPDSRRNPVEQLHKALFGYFFPPWKKYHSDMRPGKLPTPYASCTPCGAYPESAAWRAVRFCLSLI